MTRKFTGWHMTGILVAFFGTVVAVNVTMARLAIGTFGGTVVDNSYVASQHYNEWLAEARRQDELGWTVGHPVRGRDDVAIDIATAAGPLTGATVTAQVEHPLGRLPGLSLTFVAAEPGRYRSTRAVPAGRWRMRIAIGSGGDNFIAVRDIR